MPDEFPTLEAVAALGVLALLIRTLLVASEMQSAPRLAAELVKALAAGDRSSALSACNAPAAPALARSAREMLVLVGEPPYGPEAALDLQQEQRELEQDLARRGESGRARDLIVLAVLIGAMAFAVLSNLLVTSWFHVLAAFASLLVIIGYVMRSRLRRIERAELSRIGDALLAMLRAAPSPRGARRSLHSIDGGCTVCGETVFLVAHDAQLGASLPVLGIHELRICKNCGFVSGQAEDAAALALGALQELSVPLDEEDEASSDDTEHDG
jgi:Flp pilus assembly protein TadB